jgi:hypothetical protein
MSSWREIAKAVRTGETFAASAEEFGDFDNCAGRSEALIERDEREAIAIIDGGLSPEWAAYLTTLEAMPRPPGLSEAEWRKRLDAMWIRADQHGATLAAHGWTFRHLFGFGSDDEYRPELGALWLAPDARLVAIDSERIVYERAGERAAYDKPGRAH